MTESSPRITRRLFLTGGASAAMLAALGYRSTHLALAGENEAGGVAIEALRHGSRCVPLYGGAATSSIDMGERWCVPSNAPTSSSTRTTSPIQKERRASLRMRLNSMRTTFSSRCKPIRPGPRSRQT
ncbi:MAG: hypothetical protein H6512_05040 [Acidimicrobiia bacterium]|nr:hypothetical protein [Acidimicrobiia bacterium]